MLLSSILFGFLAITPVHSWSFFRNPSDGLEHRTVAVPRQVARDVGGYSPPPNDDNHNYTFSELEPTADGLGFAHQPYFRFVMLFKKHPGVSNEWYNEHWKTVHADLTIASKDVGVTILRYNQFHVDDRHKQMISPVVQMSKGAITYAPYDGIAEFYAKDYDHFEKFLSAVFPDPVVNADMQMFADVPFGIHVMGGYDSLIFGRAIHEHGGKDGILASDPRLKYSGRH